MKYFIIFQILLSLFVLSSGYRIIIFPKFFNLRQFYQDTREDVTEPLKHQSVLRHQRSPAPISHHRTPSKDNFFTKEGRNYHPSRDDGFTARFFNAFSNLKLGTIFPKTILRNEFNKLISRVTALEATAIGDARWGGDMVPVEQVRLLLAELRPRCPTASTGSQVIGDLCFTVEVEPVEFDVAAQICQGKGGILAEPAVATRQEFYTNLKNGFPAQIQEIEARQGGDRNLFIGLHQPTTFSTTFEYLSCGVTVDAFDDNIFTSIPKIDFQVAQKAAIVPPGTMWQRVGSLRGDEKQSFICQFNTLI